MRVALSVALVLSVVLSQAEPPVPTIHSESNVVLAPTLVVKKSGEIVHGLSAKDFIIEDNGVEQETRLDDMPDAESISLVVAVQCGGSAAQEFEQPEKPSESESPDRKPPKPLKAPLSGLATMVEGFLGESKSEVAVVTFDSKTKLLQDFTEDIPAVAEKLRELKGSGDGGAATLDAIYYSLDLLELRPEGRTRVLLLISESRDHGSNAKLDQVVKRVTLSNTLIYSVVFSPLRSEFTRDLKGQNPIPPEKSPDPFFNQPTAAVNLLQMAYLASNSLRKNTARAVADLTGGEYDTFRDRHTFDRSLATLSNHIRNRYLLSFQTKNPQPGLHAITVRLRVPQRNVTVLSRNRYWAAAPEAR
jgi:VWFA-related protein